MKTQAFYFIGLAIIFLLTNWVLLLPSSEKQTVEQQDYPPLSLREYIQLHNAITNDKTPNKRILLFSSDGGLGNQMLGAMSALWYAIATDRAFVGEGQKMADLDLFYDTPFDNWLVKSVKDFSNVTSVIRIDSCYKTENALKLIEELKTKYNQVSTLFLQTNCPLMKVMINDPFFTTPLINMGVDISSEKAIYGYLLRAVFKLKPETQRIIDAYEKKWEDYDSVIGIQIRMAGQAAWGSDTEVFLTPDVIPKFWECAESFAPKRGVHYYLTTDNLVALNKTIEHFKGNVEHYESGNIIHFGKNNKASFEDKQRIFVENHLLDLCDDLVISGFSTYGGLSIARSGRKHWHSVSYAGCSENKV